MKTLLSERTLRNMPSRTCIGLAPTCGAGNSDLLRPGIRLAAAERLGVHPDRVELEWIGHHYHVVYYWMGLDEVEELDPATYHLRVLLDGGEIDERVDPGEALAAAGKDLPRGRQIGERTAASVAKNVSLLLRREATDDHTPAPNGLVGGYDVRFERGTVGLRLPPGLDHDAARRRDRPPPRVGAPRTRTRGCRASRPPPPT